MADKKARAAKAQADVQDQTERLADLRAEHHSEMLKHKRDTYASLKEIRVALDQTLGNFENTSDAHNLDAARVTIDGVREDLNAVRSMVGDAMDRYEKE